MGDEDGIRPHHGLFPEARMRSQTGRMMRRHRRMRNDGRRHMTRSSPELHLNHHRHRLWNPDHLRRVEGTNPNDVRGTGAQQGLQPDARPRMAREEAPVQPETDHRPLQQKRYRGRDKFLNGQDGVATAKAAMQGRDGRHRWAPTQGCRLTPRNRSSAMKGAVSNVTRRGI